MSVLAIPASYVHKTPFVWFWGRHGLSITRHRNIRTKLAEWRAVYALVDEGLEGVVRGGLKARDSGGVRRGGVCGFRCA
jgi:hypothetical protein